MRGVGYDQSELRSLWPRRSNEPGPPPITDAELDPARAPRRNDLIHGLVVSSVPAFGLFMNYYVEVPGYESHQDFGRALIMALGFGFLLTALTYALGRLIKASARRRKGYTFGRGAKLGVSIFYGLIIAWISIEGLTKYARPLTQEDAGIAAVVGLIGGLVVLVLLSFYADIPAQPYTRGRQSVETGGTSP